MATKSKKAKILKIVEETPTNIDDSQVFDSVFEFLINREHKDIETQKLIISFDKSPEGKESFWITDLATNPSLTKLDAVEFENTFQVYPLPIYQKGRHFEGHRKKVIKTFSNEEFGSIMQSLFDERQASDYCFDHMEALLTYMKTPIKGAYNAKSYPEFEFEFLKNKKGQNQVWVSAKEYKTTVMKGIEFCHVNEICKVLNDSKKLKTEFKR